ncbi:MAG: hypothetical protein Q7R43_02075 [Candidatus Daviesbacteria bacterium]|nr:hypothetical protein [Candidatus Daviesbacteria bacterium]
MYPVESREISSKLKQTFLDHASKDTPVVVMAELNYGKDKPFLVTSEVLKSIFNKYNMKIMEGGMQSNSCLEISFRENPANIFLDISLTLPEKIQSLLRLVAYLHYGDINPISSSRFIEPAEPKFMSIAGCKKRRADNWIKRLIGDDIKPNNSFAQGLIQAVSENNHINPVSSIISFDFS